MNAPGEAATALDGPAGAAAGPATAGTSGAGTWGAGTSGAGTSGAGQSAAGPSSRVLLKSLRLPLAIALVVLIGVGILVFAGLSNKQGSLDPDAVDPAGSAALAELLRARGVKVHRVEGLADVLAHADSTGTVFMTLPEYEQAALLTGLTRLPDSVRLVLVEPSSYSLDRLTTDLSVKNASAVEKRRAPHCEFSPATAAGDADMGGPVYTAGAEDRCYGGSLATTHSRGDQPLIAVGTGTPFTNEKLDQHGNAALALGLLSGADDLWWVLPDRSAAAGPGDQKTLSQILPPWVGPVVWELFLIGFLVALWRGRRLGPVVVEPLPVVVRAAEAVEGRARLYRRARARDRAAEALRAGARARIVPFLGLGTEPSEHALVEAIAARSGRQPADIGELLFGGVPSDDPGLVHLANALDDLIRVTLDREGRRP